MLGFSMIFYISVANKIPEFNNGHHVYESVTIVQ